MNHNMERLTSPTPVLPMAHTLRVHSFWHISFAVLLA